MKAIEPVNFKVILSRSNHDRAQKFYAFQENSHKAKQVYLNTLAIYAVNYYLNCLGFETDIIAGNSWNPVMQTLMDSADLVVKDRGKIECRPVLPDAKTCYIPSEVWHERIGYVAVELNRELTEATLLGSLRKVNREFIAIERFEPIEDLISYLDRPSIIELRQWFEKVFEFDWQILDNFISPNSQQWISVRQGNIRETKSKNIEIDNKNNNSIAAAKLIDLGMQLGKQNVFLVMTIVPETEDKLGVQVQLYPLAEQAYLPPRIKLALLSDAGENLAAVDSRLHDNFIQLPYFKGRAGEVFTIQVALGNTSIVENFSF
jgi:hypothetical protein